MDLMSPPFLLFDTANQAGDEARSFLLSGDLQIIEGYSLEEGRQALHILDCAVKEGKHVGGFFAYEASALFEARLSPLINKRSNEAPPLIWLALSDDGPKRLTNSEIESFLGDGQAQERNWRCEIKEPEHLSEWFKDRFGRVQDYITAGDAYQINLTFPMSVAVDGNIAAFYLALRRSQPAAYSAFIHTGRDIILSLSPEQFIQLEDNTLNARPMKGTAKRKYLYEDDLAARDFLMTDTKSRAENLMIVDLLRNDLSRLTDSAVVTKSLFDIETLPSLHQMTSHIAAQVKPMRPSSLLRALFPCGSVTGAPKIRAQQIIDELEDTARGVYCGAIALFTEQNSRPYWSLNVPIRTLQLKAAQPKNDLTTNSHPDCLYKGQLNVGAGIVADSDCADELAECHLKARFIRTLKERSPMQQSTEHRQPDLIETMRIKGGIIQHTDLHMARLSRSAAFFGYALNQNEICEALKDYVGKTMKTISDADYKLRLLVSPTGAATLSHAPLTDAPKPVDTDANSLPKIAVHPTQVNSSDIWYYHKTTNRVLYDSAFSEAQAQGLADYVFANERGELTEGCIHNVFLETTRGEWLTPALSCGLLPGILRQQLLDAGKIRESVIRASDIHCKSKLWIGNSVRGLRRVKLLLG